MVSYRHHNCQKFLWVRRGELSDIFENCSGILLSPVGCWRLAYVGLKFSSANHRRFKGFAKGSVPQCAPQKSAVVLGINHMGSSEDEQDCGKSDGPAKIVRVVLHRVLLPCVLWLMNLKKTPQPLKYCLPFQNFFVADSF